MNVYIVPNIHNANAPGALLRAADVLRRSGAGVLLDEETAAWLGPGAPAGADVCPAPCACETCDIIVTIGGDGTMLHAAKQAMRYNKPLLGVNIGRLGFLSLIENDSLDLLARLPKGDYRVERRGVLQARAEGREPCAAMNDIVLFKDNPERTVSLEIYCDDILVSRFRGDGIIFSTPTGSTAYSMSAGGPVVDALLGGIIVTPICAHIVHTPPMVFAPSRQMRVQVGRAPGEEAAVVSDGKKLYTLPAGAGLHIGQSGTTVPLVQFSDAEQLKSIDTKLKGR